MKINSELATPYPNHIGRTLSLGSTKLASQTMANLESHFLTETLHRPTAEMYSALEPAASVLEQMADGTCPRRYFLSSLDPGVGKTSMITQFTKSLLYSPEHTEVAMVICVARLSEIKTLVTEMGLSEILYAAFTSNPALNRLGLGSDKKNKARILFTSQQMVESRCGGKSFEAASEFHFRGQPRAVRVWDESLLPAEALTVNRQALKSISARLMTTKYLELGSQLENLEQQIKGMPSGSKVRIPDLGDKRGEFDLHALLGVLKGYPADQRAMEALGHLSGRTTTVMNDGGVNNTVLSYRECLPEDFAPLLILDASGRVRETYPLWHRSPRNNLEILPSAPKTYANLTCHVCSASGGKGAFREAASRNERIDAIASLIATKPDEKWLVVHHKAESSFDVEKEVTALLPDCRRHSVAFVPWGSHRATNDYVSFTNVILAGTLFLPNSQYEALGRLSSATPDDIQLKKDMFDAVVIGEHMDQILQAACRGSIRQCHGGDCPPSNLYVIASKKSGIGQALKVIFPGCKVVRWKVGTSVLKGRRREAAEFIKAHLKQNPEELLTFKQVQEAIGMKDKANFKRNVRKHPDFIEELAAYGIVDVREGQGRAGFMTTGAACGFTVEAAYSSYN